MVLKCKKCNNEFSDILNECPQCNEHIEASDTSESPMGVLPISVSMVDGPAEEGIDSGSNREKITDFRGPYRPPRILHITPAKFIIICIIVLVIFFISSFVLHDIHSSDPLPIKSSVASPTVTPGRFTN